ncbi:hypothetical protein BZL30_3965 [Mycobacterium kansasii]|uniref:Uncharacterized protein n=1 Tax=Mycobacterium kansasii TaxID=1768 RepID=A0A1V3X9Q0_MYCKA|nr:hypothetical protein BZL30_3965 [Mycobacterium kansasii]
MRWITPAVPNGEPVKGRLSAPRSGPVKSGVRKPPVVTKSTRRIVVLPTD